MYYLILCKSLTYAQRAARVLEQAGISARPVQVPQNISNKGCGYSVRVQERKVYDALHVLDGSGFKKGRVFFQSSKGELQEVDI